MKIKFRAVYLAYLGVILLLALGWASRFFYLKIKNISQIIEEAQAKINLLDSEEKEFARSLADLKASEEQIKTLSSVFLSEETFVDFVELVEHLARISGVAIKIESANTASASSPASLSFVLDGDFRGIAKFLALLDKIPIAGMVNGMEITPRAARGEEKISPDAAVAKISYIIFNFIK